MISGARLQFYATAPCRVRHRSATRDGLSFNRQPHLKPITMRLLSRSTFSRSLRTSALGRLRLQLQIVETGAAPRSPQTNEIQRVDIVLVPRSE
jgi:hypothetical protein